MATNCTIWAWAMAPEVRTPAQLVVLLKLADMAHPDGKTWPSHAYLAEKLGLSDRAVRSAINEMTGRFLRTEPRAGKSDIIWLAVTAVTTDPISSEEMEAGRRGRPKTSAKSGATSANSCEPPTKSADEPKREPETEPKREGTVVPLPGSADASPARQAFDLYNEFANRVPMAAGARLLTAGRRRGIAARLKECGGLEGWKVALLMAERSPFLSGITHHKFAISLDFLIQPSSFAKLLEGRYNDERQSSGPAGSSGPTRVDTLREGARHALEELRRRRGGGPEGGPGPSDARGA